VAATAAKAREGQVEMIRVLRVARRGAMKARVAAAHQLYGVLYSAPEELRQPLLGLKTKALMRMCAAMRPGPLTSPPAATKASLRTLARRWQQLQSELTQLDTQLQQLVTSHHAGPDALPPTDQSVCGTAHQARAVQARHHALSYWWSIRRAIRTGVGSCSWRGSGDGPAVLPPNRWPVWVLPPLAAPSP
jgi:hypothetical protein